MSFSLEYADKIDRTGSCWIWTGRLDRDGYGRDRKGAGVHRLAFEEASGPIPAGLTVDHICFQPACVNPAHLRLLTHRENASNQRSALKDSCINGHPFTEDNTYLRLANDGKRDCRRCGLDRVRRYRERKAAA